MNPAHTFDPHQHVRQIVIAGLGGTGSQLARSVARMVYDMRRRRQHTPELLFVDPDVVEARNVGRQLFTPADAGHPKAESLARRFNYALGLDIAWANQPLDSQRHVARGTVVLGAVDNHAARAEMARAEGVIWIDCGNHFASGQVAIGNTGDREQVMHRMRSGRYFYLPHAGLLFPALLQPEPEGQGAPTREPAASCAQLVENGQQHLLVNDFMALAAAQYLYQLLHRQPITSFLTYVNSRDLSMCSLPIGEAELLPYLQAEPH
ncbi:MAG: hypothetical protein GY767_08805 [Shimia sp.]|nr:hypothetical protein [Shimia sp.]